MPSKSPAPRHMPSSTVCRRFLAATAVLVLFFADAAPVLAQNATQPCFGAQPTIVGTASSDTLTGTSGRDVIVALGGNDQIYGLDGGDVICGGDGFDSIDSGDGNDEVDGGGGFDTLYGGGGDDILVGGADADSAYGGAGDDFIRGGAGADVLSGEAGNDTLDGEDGSDQMLGGIGNDVLNGGAGDDTIDCGDGTDYADGGIGRDSITGASGNDRVFGGDDDDVAYGGDGDDLVAGGGGRDTLAGDAGNDSVDGQDGDDSASGGTGNDFVSGGPGFDTTGGDAGNDIIDGGPDADTLDGGAGADVCRQETPDNSIGNCETFNNSARFETANGLRQWVVASAGGTLSWAGYSLAIPARALSQDCWASLTRIASPVPAGSGDAVGGLVNYDIECPWTGAVTVGVPAEFDDGATTNALVAHFVERTGTWEPITPSRVVGGVAYATVTSLSPLAKLGLVYAREVEWCKRSLSNFRVCVTAYIELGGLAHAATLIFMGSDGFDNEADAFRHCYWHATMTYVLGAATAKTIGDNHEGVDPGYDFNTVEPANRRMDLWNNAVGRLVSGFPSVYCLQALNDGRLRRIDRGLFEPTGMRVTYGDPARPSPVPAPTPAPAGSRRVTVTKGGSAQGRPGCSSSACAYMVVTASGFTPNNSVTIECGSTSEGTFYTYYARTDGAGATTTANCYYGYPGRTAWARVNGVEGRLVW